MCLLLMLFNVVSANALPACRVCATDSGAVRPWSSQRYALVLLSVGLTDADQTNVRARHSR
jgi:hypothetical protein